MAGHYTDLHVISPCPKKCTPHAAGGPRPIPACPLLSELESGSPRHPKTPWPDRAWQHAHQLLWHPGLGSEGPAYYLQLPSEPGPRLSSLPHCVSTWGAPVHPSKRTFGLLLDRKALKGRAGPGPICRRTGAPQLRGVSSRTEEGRTGALRGCRACTCVQVGPCA